MCATITRSQQNHTANASQPHSALLTTHQRTNSFTPHFSSRQSSTEAPGTSLLCERSLPHAHKPERRLTGGVRLVAGRQRKLAKSSLTTHIVVLEEAQPLAKSVASKPLGVSVQIQSLSTSSPSTPYITYSNRSAMMQEKGKPPAIIPTRRATKFV